MRGSWRTGIALLVLFGTAVPAAAGDNPPEAAVEVLEAVRGKAAERLTTLARAVENDPWRMVDDLVAAGHDAAAKAYAAATEEPYATPLRRYVANVPKDDAASRKTLAKARTLADDGRLEQALEALDGVTPRAGTVLAYRVPALRAFLCVDLERYGEVEAHVEHAADAGEALGRDLVAERKTVFRDWLEIGWREDPLVALRAAERLAELSRHPYWSVVTAGAYLDLASACLGCNLADRARRLLLRARSLYGQALQDERARPDWPAVRLKLAYVLLRLCGAYSLADEAALAFESGEQAVDAFRKLKGPVGEAEAHWVLGDAYSAAGIESSAYECYRSARNLLQEAGETYAQHVFELRVNEGSALQEMGKLDEALPILSQAAEEIRDGVRGAVPAVTLMNLGEAQLRAGLPDAALTTLRRALDALESDPIHEAWCRMLIGDALTVRGTTSDAGRLVEAEASYRTALTLLPPSLEPALRMYILTGLGETRLARKHAQDALAHARSCIDLLESMTGGMADGEAVSARGHEDRLRAVSLGVAAARATNDARVVLEMLERSRARTFLAALGGRRGVRRATLATGAKARIEAADRQLLRAVQRYRRAIAAGAFKRVQPARKSLDAARAAHHRTTTSVERRARLQDRALLPEPVSLDDLHAAMRPGECAVLYGLLDRRSVALVVTGGRAWVVDLPSRKQIEEVCADLAAEDPKAPLGEVAKAVRKIGQTLLGGLRLPKGVRHLLVSPDGALAHLPWPWIVDRQLGDKVDVTLVPSATSLLALAGDPVAGSGRVALGNPDYGQLADDAARTLYLGRRTPDPLLESAEEARAAAGPGGVLLLAEQATEGELQKAVADKRPLQVLHLACHGIVNRARPELSALALTPSEDDDGFLTALEVSALDIPANLVVLSACESGRDRAARGEGIQGLARAFLLAGAEQLVVSMWKVDDEATRLFMQRFYEEWGEEGVGVHEALRRARSAVAHPSAWAAWVVWGAPR